MLLTVILKASYGRDPTATGVRDRHSEHALNLGFRETCPPLTKREVNRNMPSAKGHILGVLLSVDILI